MERAKIRIMDGSQDILEVQYNPTQYNDNFSVDWQDDQFPKVVRDNFSLELFFDSYEAQQDVREDYTDPRTSKLVYGTRRFASLAYPSFAGQETRQPPPCLFTWGNFNFYGHVLSVKQVFTMFLDNGTPVRAKLTLDFKHFPDARQIREALGVEACRKVRTVQIGDRLDLIAFEEMKDASLWPKIAKINNIENPFFFPTKDDIGRTLIIPDVNEKV